MLQIWVLISLEYNDNESVGILRSKIEFEACFSSHLIGFAADERAVEDVLFLILIDFEFFNSAPGVANS